MRGARLTTTGRGQAKIGVMGGSQNGLRHHADGHDGADVPVAIIGMAARAARAPDVEELWRLIESGQDAIVDIPADRLPGFDAERLGATPPRAALLDRIDAFDASFFGLSPRQAVFMDPRQRLLLEETWHALEDAGIAPDALAGSATGVFVGSMGADFMQRCDGLGAIDRYTASGTLDAFLANRISYQFDARGCSVEVDTACSSGLTAVVQGAWALAGGQVNMAIAGGVSVICHGFDQEALLRAGVLSPNGRVRPFSEEADGYVRGEGVAVVVMKRLADALRDNDPVRAVIMAAAQAHDGRTGGQFGPSAQTQAALIRRTTAKAGISPAELGYVEAHATGTKLGDKAEATGLVAALDGAGKAAGPDGRLWVGVLKTVIGHTEGAAGLFGLIKAVLVLEHDLIPGIPALSEPPAGQEPAGQEPAGQDVVLGFPAAGVPWPRADGQPRLAGVNSFGLGGAIAHVVLCDPPARAATPSQPGIGARIFPLSAATPSALDTLTGSVRNWLHAHPDADLAAVAWTLQAGRAALPHRVVLHGDELIAESPPDAGPVVAAFLAGDPVDWSSVWDGVPPGKIGLPGYPFEPQSHWPRAERPPAALPARPLPPGPRPHVVTTQTPATRETPGNAELTRQLRRLAGECLYLAEEEVDVEAELTDMGLDSVLAVEFLAKLNSDCGTSLTLTEMYERRTLAALATALAQVGAEAR